MSGRSDVERVLDSFLGEGPHRVSDQALLRTLDAIDRTTQRRGLTVPWRFPDMYSFTRLAAAIALAVIAIGGALYVALPRSDGVGTPTATPAASATPALSATTMPPDPSTWQPFRSSRYGYLARFPEGWAAISAEQDWTFQTRAEFWSSGGAAADRFVDYRVSESDRLHVTAVAATMPPGTTTDAWIDAYEALPEGSPVTCVPAADMEAIFLSGHAGRLATDCDNAAFVAVGDRMFVFSIDSDSEGALFRAFLSTVQLPASEVDLNTDTWTAFESARYGYSARYPADWGPVPSTIDWQFETRFAFWGSNGDGADRFIQTGTTRDLQLHLTVFAGDVPAGTTAEAWIDAWETPDPDITPECVISSADMVPIDIDGHDGLTATSCATEAFVLVGHRLFVFSLDGPNEVLTAFLTTVHLPAG